MTLVVLYKTHFNCTPKTHPKNFFVHLVEFLDHKICLAQKLLFVVCLKFGKTEQWKTMMNHLLLFVNIVIHLLLQKEQSQPTKVSVKLVLGYKMFSNVHVLRLKAVPMTQFTIQKSISTISSGGVLTKTDTRK